MDEELSVHIDLYNLEDVKFEGSKYVLTSPRSLEACSRLGVKPIELLYRPLSEFQEELLPQDVPLRTIYTVYDESEQIRQKKLRLCREERTRLITEDQKKSNRLSRQAHLYTLPSEDAKERQARPKKRLTFSSGVGKSTGKKRSDKESSKLHRELLSKKDKNQSRPRSAPLLRSQSAERRKPQRCAPSVTIGTKVKYRSGSAHSVKLPARDEKILRLMKVRRETEKKELAVSDQAHRLWEDQRKREEALRTIAENKRRQLLAEENRIKDMRKHEDRERRAQLEEQDREIQKLKIKQSELTAEKALMNQLRMQELQLCEKVRKETAMRENQEKNLKAKEKEEEEMKELLLAKQAKSLQSALEKKDVRIHQESLKKFLSNRQERELFEKRQNLLKSQELENELLVKSSMENRLSQAEVNFSHVLDQRNRQLEEKHREESAKLERARLAQQRQEEELEVWRQEMCQQKKMMEDRASEVVSQSVEMKAWQARKNRLSKEQEQRKNMAKILKDDQRKRRELELSLHVKDRKVDEMLEEKEKTVAQTRALAQISQTLRDDVREKYEADTFDKKVLEAQLYANLYSNHRSRSPAPSRNTRSSIKIC